MKRPVFVALLFFVTSLFVFLLPLQLYVKLFAIILILCIEISFVLYKYKKSVAIIFFIFIVVATIRGITHYSYDDKNFLQQPITIVGEVVSISNTKSGNSKIIVL